MSSIREKARNGRMRQIFAGDISNKTQPRDPTAGSALILSAVGVLTLSFVWPHAGGIPHIAVLLLILLAGLYIQSIQVVHITMFAMLFLLPQLITHSSGGWPLYLLIPLVGYLSLCAVVPAMRKTMGWPKIGRFNMGIAKLFIATIALSAGCLVGWLWLMKPDLNSYWALLPVMPVWVLPFAGLGFALLNAAMEEIVFRGILLEALDGALGAGFGSVVIQALSFAALHYVAGFPNGVVGFVLVLIYGLLLGGLRRLSHGLLVPFAAHVVTDISIFAMLLWARHTV